MEQFNRLQHTRCIECPLQDRKKVLGFTERGKGKIIILGEAPGKEEDETGFPFVGPAGRLLDVMLKDVGIDRDECWVTNRILCRPPNNNFQSEEAREAVGCCSNGLFTEFQHLNNQGYECILVLGNNALGAFGLRGIGRWKGELHMSFDAGLKILPTYHPSYILRNGGKKLQETQSDLWLSWKEDFQKVQGIV